MNDIAQGHILAMEKGKICESYLIAGEPLKIADGFILAAQISKKSAPMVAPFQMIKTMSVLVRPFDAILPEGYTSEGLRIIAGVTYIGGNSKAKWELGYNPRPLREGWEETIRHTMELLGEK